MGVPSGTSGAQLLGWTLRGNAGTVCVCVGTREGFSTGDWHLHSHLTGCQRCLKPTNPGISTAELESEALASAPA